MKKKTDEYISKATTTLIRVSSRASVKISDNYYTVEFCEERSIPEDANVAEERKLLWETANNECDFQIQEIVEAYGKKRK